MFGLKGSLITGIIIATLVGGISYIATQLVKTRVALELSNKQINVLKHHRQETEKATANAEKELYTNLEIQRNALQQIYENGHLSGDSNPKWMREFETPSNHISDNS